MAGQRPPSAIVSLIDEEDASGRNGADQPFGQNYDRRGAGPKQPKRARYDSVV
jgi:hypothetical protein